MWRFGLAVALAVSLTLAPLAAEAQESGKVPRIGWLSANLTVNPHMAAYPGWSMHSGRSVAPPDSPIDARIRSPRHDVSTSSTTEVDSRGAEGIR